MRKIYNSILFVLISFSTIPFSGVLAQRLVSGKVIDSLSKSPLVGASVLILGTDKGAVTDIDGNFKIMTGSVEYNTVRISLLGYKSKNVEATINLRVELSPDRNPAILAGVVIDTSMGFPYLITNSKVELKRSGRFVFTDDQGRFELPIDINEDTLLISKFGYITKVIDVRNLNVTRKLSIYLVQDPSIPPLYISGIVSDTTTLIGLDSVSIRPWSLGIGVKSRKDGRYNIIVPRVFDQLIYRFAGSACLNDYSPKKYQIAPLDTGHLTHHEQLSKKSQPNNVIFSGLVRERDLDGVYIPVNNVLVTIQYKQLCSTITNTTIRTNADGRFTLSALAELGAVAKIELTKNGYETLSKTITVSENTSTNLTLVKNCDFSQSSERLITGIVTDKNKQPLIGASISIVGTSYRAITAIDGSYQLKIPNPCVALRVDLTGFISVEIRPHEYPNNNINVVLTESEGLGEVVLTALLKRGIYGTIRDTFSKEPIGGARVLDKRTRIGTLSEIDGSYNFDAQKRTLTFFHKDYLPKEVSIPKIDSKLDSLVNVFLVPRNCSWVVTRTDDPTESQLTASMPSWVGTLRWAVRMARTCANSRITFNIPGNGPHYIRLNEKLNIKHKVEIDGSTQPGYKKTPNVIIDLINIPANVPNGSVDNQAISSIKGLGFVNPNATAIYSASNLTLINNEFQAPFNYGTRLVWLDGDQQYNVIDNVFTQKLNPNSSGIALSVLLKEGNITGNTFNGFATGIKAMGNLRGSKYPIQISKNTIVGKGGQTLSSYGINANLSYAKMSENNITAVSEGISLNQKSEFNLITQNIIHLSDGLRGTYDACIILSGASNNIISDNEMDYDAQGIKLKNIKEDELTINNVISRNLFSNLTAQHNKPIDIQYNTSSPCNLNKKPPTITSMSFNARGDIIVSGKSEPKDVIEIFQSDFLTARNIHKYLSTTTANAAGDWVITVLVVNLEGGIDALCDNLTLAATATRSLNTSELTYQSFYPPSQFPIANFNYTFTCFDAIVIDGQGSTFPNTTYSIFVNGTLVYNSPLIPSKFPYTFPHAGVFMVEYKVQYRINGKLCSISTTRQINIPNSSFSYNIGTIQVTDVTCSPLSDGSAKVTVNGGTAPYSYSLNGAQYSNAPVLSNLAPGNYTAYVKDVNGCVTSQAFQVKDKSPQINIRCMPYGACSPPGVAGTMAFIVVQQNLSKNFHFNVLDSTTQQVIVKNALGVFGIEQTVLLKSVLENHVYKVVLLDEPGNDPTWNQCPLESKGIKAKQPPVSFSYTPLESKCFPNQPIDVELVAKVTPSTSGCISKLPAPNFLFEVEEPAWISRNAGKAILTAANQPQFSVKVTYDPRGFNCVSKHDVVLNSVSNLETKLFTEDIYCNNSPQKHGGRARVEVSNGTHVFYQWYEVAKPAVILSTNYFLDTLKPNTKYAVLVWETLEGDIPGQCPNNNHPTYIFSIKEIPPVSKPIIDKKEAECSLSARVAHTANAAPYTFAWTRFYESTLKKSKTVQIITPTGVKTSVTVYDTIIIRKDQWYHDVVQTWSAGTGVLSVPNKKPVPGKYVVAVTDANGCFARSDTVEFKQDTTPRSYDFAIRWRTPKIEAEPIVAPSESPLSSVKTTALNIKQSIENQTEDCINLSVKKLMVDAEAFCQLPDSVNDKLNLEYDLQAYQYTLYYYDRAGNLVRTVAPNGVQDTLTRASMSLQHQFVTTYDYNSLGQLTRQSSPDAGITHFLYNDLTQLRFSQNARQKSTVPERYSYSKYDPLGRIIESGESKLGANQVFSSLNTSALLQGQPDFPTTGNAEQTFTVYSSPALGVNYFGKPQRFIDNKISHNWNINLNGDTAATYYSYDPHGNVEWVAQKIPGFTTNYLGYDYDLISNKVRLVKYNQGFQDRFFHRYSYDEDNRLTVVETSKDSVIWERDAQYNYYVHGPLRSLILGHDNLQKIDYTYTIQGWLKGINTPDARETSLEGGGGKPFGKDLFGMALGYFYGDFTHQNSLFDSKASALAPAILEYKPLYNGNIAYWISHGSGGNPKDPFLNQTTAEVYTYDYLNRIRSSEYRTGGGFTSPHTKFATAYTYDPAGNITSLHRNGGKADIADEPMDRLSYRYKTQNNQLTEVKDEVPASRYTDDLDDQADTTNYQYDALGNLVRDKQEGHTYTWNVQGKLAEVIPDRDTATAKQKPYLRFSYDPLGNRIKKEVFYQPYNSAGTLQLLPDSTRTTYYALSSEGQQMAIYERSTHKLSTGGYRAKWSLDAVNLYGNDRLGEYQVDSFVYTYPFKRVDSAYIKFEHKPFRPAPFSQRFYSKNYELTDHLGNVRKVFLDRHLFDAEIVKTSNVFYPYGMPISDRSFNVNSYRYGYNKGSEKDGELTDQPGRYFTTEFRNGDTYLGRWWSTDPDSDKQPWQSPYCSMDNNPILNNDPDGNIVPILLAIWAGVEVGLAVYDTYDAASTLLDENATTLEKATSVGGLLMGAILPGGGYGTVGKQAAKQVEKKLIKEAVEQGEKKLVKETAEQVEKKVVEQGTTKAEQLAKNKAQGIAKEKVEKEQLVKELKPNQELLEQATFKMADGKKSRPDFTVVNKDKKSIENIIDVKSGNAKKTPNQKALEQKGGTLTGKKAGAYKGLSTPPTKIEIR